MILLKNSNKLIFYKNKKNKKKFKFCVNMMSNNRTMKVFDVFSLLNIKTKQEMDIENTLSSLWSLQYTIPNIIHASVGYINFNQNGNKTCIESLDSYKYALHYRFGQSEHVKLFLQHPDYKSLDFDVLNIFTETKIPNDLESIFRRGENWDIGCQLVILTKLLDKKEDASSEYLNLLSDVANSSAIAALQSSTGYFTKDIQNDFNSKYMTLCCYFNDNNVMNGFMMLPPVKNIFDDNLLFEESCAFSYKIAETKGKKTSSKDTNYGYL